MASSIARAPRYRRAILGLLGLLVCFLCRSVPIRATTEMVPSLQRRDTTLVLRADGTVQVQDTCVCVARAAGQDLVLTIPLREGQFIEALNVDIAEMRGDDENPAWYRIPRASEAPEQAVIYYRTEPSSDGRRLRARIVTAHAEGDTLRLRLSYTLRGALVRHRDAVVGRICYEAPHLAGAATLTFLFPPDPEPHDSRAPQALPVSLWHFGTEDDTVDYHSTTVATKDLLAAGTVPDSAESADPEAWQLELLALPGAGIQELLITLDTDRFPGLVPAKADDYRVLPRLREGALLASGGGTRGNIASGVLTVYPWVSVAALLYLLIFLLFRVVLPYRRAHRTVREAGGELLLSLTPADVSYLMNGHVKGRTLQATVEELIRRGYLNYYRHHLLRVPERELPDETALSEAQRRILHGIWEMMEGGSDLPIDAFRTRTADDTYAPEAARQLHQYRECLRESLRDQGLLHRGPCPHPTPWLVIPGLLLVAWAILMAVVRLPLRALLPAGVGLLMTVLSFVHGRLTRQGKIRRITLVRFRAELPESLFPSEPMAQRPSDTMTQFERYYPYLLALDALETVLATLVDRAGFDVVLEHYIRSKFVDETLETELRALREEGESRPDGNLPKIRARVKQELQQDARAYGAAVLHVKMNRYKSE